MIKVAYGVEKKKVDGQGRFLLPSDWRVDLTKFFDTADLGRNIEDWAEFERRFYDEVS